jgi:CarD family transcriptional regulator
METVQVPKAATQAKSLTTTKAQVSAKSPVKSIAKSPVTAKPTITKPAMTKPIPAPPIKTVKDVKSVAPFSNGDFVVYPAHGVGKVTSIETQLIGGQKVELFVISFERDRMTLRVPVRKVENSGLRKLSTRKVMEAALTTLKGRARVKRAMWSRRAQEYEAKINSGDPVSIAEVVRDLHRGASQPEQSYSERQIYEQALERLAHEVAAVEKIKPEAATAKLEKLLNAA